MASYKDVFSIHANTNTHSCTHTSRYFNKKTKKEGWKLRSTKYLPKIGTLKDTVVLVLI